MLHRLKLLLLSIVFSNKERGIINASLSNYAIRLMNTMSDTAKEQSLRASILMILFKFNYNRSEPYPFYEMDFTIVESEDTLRRKEQLRKESDLLMRRSIQLSISEKWQERSWE